VTPARVELPAADPRVPEGETTPRTVSGHDIGTFACLVGDYSRIHLDEHFSAALQRGGRIAHGLLSASWALGGLSLDAPWRVGRRDPNACPGAFVVNYRQPVPIGTTLRCRWRAQAAERQRSRDDDLRTDFWMIDHDDQVVTDGHVLVCRPDTTATGEVQSPQLWPAATFEPDLDKICFLEDFHPGSHAGETEGRTLTESDVVAYGAFTGDSGGHYGDEQFARAGRFGARIVQPMLAFNIGFSLWLRDWCRMPTPDSGMAGHLGDRWSMHRPFFLGDTLRCRHRTLATRISRSRPGMGILTSGLQLINQRDEVAMSAEVIMMYPARAG